jgi:hypothetical protein
MYENITNLSCLWKEMLQKTSETWKHCSVIPATDQSGHILESTVMK